MIRAIYQRLKELDPETFEALCFQIWSDKLPGVELKHVEGKGGDKGTDIFGGRIAERPAIWQCKFFRDGMKDVQKRQVKKSLKTVLRHFKPALWTLCIPINLDINAHNWFQKLTRSNADGLKIELFDASMMVKELVYRRPIREAFFPGVMVGLEEIREMLRGTGDFTEEQLGKRADESVDQYVERLRQKDPRYDYQVSFLSGNAAMATSAPDARPLFPNTIFSMREGNRQVDLIARDVEALRKDPPSVTLTLTANGVEKIQRSLLSGAPTQLGHGELVGFRSSFDFLMSANKTQQPHELLVVPKRLSFTGGLCVTFSSRDDRVVYDLIQFLVTRTPEGTDIRSTDENLPFRMRVILNPETAAYHFDITSTFHGHDIIEVAKFFRAMRALREGGTMELRDPKSQQSIGPLSIELTHISEDREQFERLTEDLAEVSRGIGQKLIAPEVITGKDIESLPFLLEVVRHGEVTAGALQNLTAKLVKDDRPTDVVFGPLATPFAVGIENDNYPTQNLLGTEINLGPWRLVAENASLIDHEQAKSRFAILKEGESMPVSFNSDGPVRQIFHKFYKGAPLQPLSAP